MTVALLDRPARIVDDATRRQVLGGAGALLLTAACGQDRPPPAGPDAPDAAGRFPVTIDHALGTITIPTVPQRVVALGDQDADIAVALGMVPVGIAAYSYSTDGWTPWLARQIGRAPVEILDTASGAPLERIAGLEPDVILAGGYFGIDGEYGKLTGIAPVVAYRGTQRTYGWQSHAVDVGRVLGRETQARAAVAGVETAIRDIRGAHPEFAGKTYSSSFYYEADAMTTINSTQDYAAQLLGELGLVLSPAVLALEGDFGAQVSLERLGVLDADVLLMSFASDDLRTSLETNPVFAAVPAVSRGDYIPLSVTVVSAVTIPSVLSIPYGFEQLVPALAAALA